MAKLTFIDLFAGAGGLSEGFIRAGFEPIAHVEMDHYACDTLRTRAAFHYLSSKGKLSVYEDYLRNKKEKENGQRLWDKVPKEVVDSVIQAAIGPNTLVDIFTKIDEKLKGRHVDVVIGGPPCQAYSVAGRARLGKKVEDDPRNELYRYYVEFIKNYEPSMLVFENVLGLKTAKSGAPFADLKRLLDEAGYSLDCVEQIASEHGVLQKRHRLIIVGWRKNLPLHYPSLIKEQSNYKTLEDLFSDLPPINAGEGSLCGAVPYISEGSQYLKESQIRGSLSFTTQHIARPVNANDRQIYLMAINKYLKEEKQLSYTEIPSHLQKHKNKDKFLNRFSVVNPNGVCHTVVAHIAMDGHYYIYPVNNPNLENVRSISVREAARLQSFPDDYFFEGSRSAAFRQIGNAVPVVLAHRVAKDLFNQLSTISHDERGNNKSDENS